MKRVVFTARTNKVGSESEEIIQIDSDTTEDEISDMVTEWAWDRGFLGWYEVE